MPDRSPAFSPHFNHLMAGYFRRGQEIGGIRPHGTPDWLLIVTRSGQGQIDSDAGPVIANAGDALLYAPSTPHTYRIAPGASHWEIYWTHFHPRPHWNHWLDWPTQFPGLMKLRLIDPAIRRQVTEQCRSIVKLTRGPFPNRDLLAMASLESLLIWCASQSARRDSEPVDESNQMAMRYICQNLSGDLSIERLAHVSGQSVSKLTHKFHSQTGLTPQQFIEQRRLTLAIELLRSTETSVKQIANKTGYATPYYFSLRFKRFVGVSPQHYRKQCSQKPR